MIYAGIGSRRTPDDGQALRIAMRLRIPVFNWFFDDAEYKLRTFLWCMQ